MVIASGLLALMASAVVAADGPSGPSGETTTYQVRILTLDGLEWRTASYSRLQPVCRQGSSTIWTADKALAATLADRASDASAPHRIMAVGEAEVTKAETLHYVGSNDRVADGPINQSSAIAFIPRPEQVEERFSIRVSGRKLDQGILARISLEETHIEAIHTVCQSEALQPSKLDKTPRSPAEVGREILKTMLESTPAALTPTPSGTSVTSWSKIPEVSRAKVEGEWLIPNDGVLLVSLGVKTAADRMGMAVARERVAVIEAKAGSSEPIDPNSTVARNPNGFEHIKLAQPATPARSLPEPTDANGNAVDLPPLPEALASTELDRIKPEPNQPSPQAPIISAPAMSDGALARTSFDAAPPAPRASRRVFLTEEESRSVIPARVLQALIKAGIDLDIELEDGSLTKIDAAKSEKDATSYCPADARALQAARAPGGMVLTPFDLAPQINLRMKGVNGVEVQVADISLEESVKNPGRTETTLVPMGDGYSVEVKTTLVPTPTEKPKAAAARTPSTTPAARR